MPPPFGVVVGLALLVLVAATVFTVVLGIVRLAQRRERRGVARDAPR